MIAGVGHQRVFIRGPNLQAYLCIPADGQTPPGLKVHSEPTSVTEDCNFWEKGDGEGNHRRSNKTQDTNK